MTEPTPLEKIQQAIAAQESLRGVLPDAQIEAALKDLFQKKAALLAQNNSGAVAQGAGALAIGERGVNAHRADIIITGNKNNLVINKFLEGLTASPEQLQVAINHYLTWLINDNRTISLKGIQHEGQNQIELPLDTVYVPLAAAVTPREKKGRVAEQEMAAPEMAAEQRHIPLNDVLKQGHRLIITGGPGSGKSTVLQFIAWIFAEAMQHDQPQQVQAKLSWDDTQNLPLPILIPLNQYAAYRFNLPADATAEQCTLQAFVSHYLIKRQGARNLPHDFFQQLLQQNKPVLLLLDGLDEVADRTQREQVTQAIEDVVKGQTDLRVLVTCRTAAYKGQSILSGFREIQVQPLADEHLTALVTQAYRAVYPHRPAKAEAASTDLLEGIANMETERQRRLNDRATPLVTSPLLVRMLLLVHLSNQKLPEQRADLYKQATDNLIQALYNRDRDAAEAIAQRAGGSLKQLEMVQDIAFHMHQQGAEAGRDIDEFDLQRAFKGDVNVHAFVTLTKERGTVMAERDGQYRFIHLGFQEFLVGRYLREVLLLEQKLTQFLMQEERLLDSWWREPILLMVGYTSLSNSRQAMQLVLLLAGLAGPRGGPLRQLPMAEQWAGAELAATALLEWPQAEKALKKQVAERLVDLIEGESDGVNPRLRAGVGMALSQLGDPRPGVGLRADGLPDIRWGKDVPAGEYAIGGDKEALRSFDAQTVSIAEPYALAKHPVTYEQFQAFVAADDFDDEHWWQNMPEEQKAYGRNYVTKEVSAQEFPYANHPREKVSWYQAVAFCRWLSAKLKLEIRLPHEYEWEVAARYNDGRVYPWGNVEIDDSRANYDEILDQSTAVGLYPAGRQPHLDLYDLSGNVWEWCQNKYSVPAKTRVDANGSSRGLRGGSWFDLRNFTRPAVRHNNQPDDRSGSVGFRLLVVRSSSYL